MLSGSLIEGQVSPGWQMENMRISLCRSVFASANMRCSLADADVSIAINGMTASSTHIWPSKGAVGVETLLDGLRLCFRGLGLMLVVGLMLDAHFKILSLEI